MTLEDELVNLCHRFFDAPQKDKTTDNISSFFSRVINGNKKIKITADVRYFIPLLAAYKDGILVSFLETTIDGISPLHYVPDLQLTLYNTNKSPRPPSSKTERSPKAPRTARSSKNPRNRRAKTARTQKTEIDDLPIPELKLHNRQKTSRISNNISWKPQKSGRKSSRQITKPSLPPMTQTQDDVLSNLYIRDSNNFYTAKKIKKEELDYHIVPPSYPKDLIGNTYSVFSSTGVVTFNQNRRTSFVDLPQFVTDQANTFIVEKQLFKLHNAFRCFYTWRDRYREKQFKKIITSFDDQNSVSRPGFKELLDKIHQNVVEKTESLCIYDIAFDAKLEDVEFDELQTIANKSIAEMDDTTFHLTADTGNELDEFFRQIRATNLLMQLDFDELHSLSALPPSLQSFASDLRWRYPSIWRQKLREKLLVHERKIALRRQNYLGKFFMRVHSIFTGNLTLQCKRILTEFLQRFSTECKKKRRIHRVYATFDFDEGMKINPSRKDFLRWISVTIEEIKNAFLTIEKQISAEVITNVDPDFVFYTEDPKVILLRFKELKKISENSLTEINAVYTFFDLEMHNHAYFLKRLKEVVDSADDLKDLTEIEKLEAVIADLVKIENELCDRPKNIFHKVLDSDENTDFVLDMRPALDMATKYLHEGIDKLKSRIINELNNNIFSEIQEKWATVKEGKIKASDTRYLEIRFVLYAVLCEAACSQWDDLMIKLKGSFDTILRIYRILNERSKYTHDEAIASFNVAAEKVGIGTVSIRKSKIEEIDEEEEEEEEEIEDAENLKVEKDEGDELASGEGEDDENIGLTFSQTNTQTD